MRNIKSGDVLIDYKQYTIYAIASTYKELADRIKEDLDLNDSVCEFLNYFGLRDMFESYTFSNIQPITPAPKTIYTL